MMKIVLFHLGVQQPDWLRHFPLMNADFNSGQNKLNENYKMQASKLKTHLDLIGWGQEAKSVNQLLLSKQALPNKSIGAFQKSYFI